MRMHRIFSRFNINRRGLVWVSIQFHTHEIGPGSVFFGERFEGAFGYVAAHRRAIINSSAPPG